MTTPAAARIYLRDESKPIRNVTTRIASPELAVVPPCRDCGRVPKQYSRFADGTVQCAADSLKECYDHA